MGLALAAGVVVAQNDIGNTVESFIGSATGPADRTMVTSAGGVEVNSNSTSTIDSQGVAVGASASIVGLAGSGASALNNTDSTITAVVQNGATVGATGAVQIEATDAANIDSTVGAGAFSVGVVAVSIGVSLNNSTIGDTVNAYIGKATVTTSGGAVDVSATSTATIGGEAVATSVAAGIGGSGAGGESTSTDNVATQAYLATGANVATHGGQLNITSKATPQISAEADGGSLGLVSAGVMLSTATLNGPTRAYIGEGVTVNAGDVSVKSLSQDNGNTDAVTATTSLVNIGGVAIGVTNATASIEDTTEAFIGREAGTTPTNGPTTITVTGGSTLLVESNSTTTAQVNAPGGTAGLISVSSTSMNANVDGSTNAYLGGDVTFNAPTATVEAQSNNGGSTKATMVGVAAVAANVAQVEAENSRGVTAYVATGADVKAPTTTLTLQANSTESATANLNGGNGGLINVAVLLDSSTVSGTTQAYVPAGATVNLGGLNVKADVVGANANNNSTLVSIGLAAGAGTQSNATVSGSSIAYVNGNGSTLQVSGPLSISANATSGTMDGANVGAGGVLSAAGASATADDSESTKAYLAAGAALVGPGPVRITADGTAVPTINLTVGSGGVISGGGATATVNDTASTQAYMDTGSTIGTAANPSGSVTIAATGIDEGSNNVAVGSGGVLTGNGASVATNVNPTIRAYLANNAKIYSSGSVDVTATSTRAEAHATGTSIAVGGVAVGIPNVTATAAPTVKSYLSQGSVIGATGDVNVAAAAQDTPGQTLNDQIQGVDPTTGTITFPESGLNDGDLVQYNPEGDATPIQTPNGPLDPNRVYQAIVTGPNTLKLGATFAAVPIGPGVTSGVDPVHNAIDFSAPDQFETGDAVEYDTNGGGSISNELNPNAVYYVRTLTANSIELYQTKAAAQAGGNNEIPLDNLANAQGGQDIYLAITGPATSAPTGDELLAPGGASLRATRTPPGSGITTADAEGGAGGFAAFPFPSSTANLNPTVQAWVDATSVTAGGNVSILANTLSSVADTANNGCGGVVAVGEASATANYNGSARAFVGAINGSTIDATGVNIQAGGNIAVDSGEQVTTNVNSSTTSGGFIAGVDAEATSSVTTYSLAAIGANGLVSGNTVAVDAINPSLNENTDATADAFGVGASTTANTTNNATGSAVAHIYPNATVTGTQGVDVIANNDNFTNSQDPSTTNISLTPFLVFGGPTTNASFTTNVIGDAGATVTAGPRGVGPANLENKGALIALYVDAEDSGVSATESRTVVWNANVNLIDGVSPILVIGPNGNIVQASGLSVNDGPGNPTQTSGQITSSTIVVNDLAAANTGQALFVGANSVTNSANNPYPVFNVSNDYQAITIINQSSKDLEIQNIETATGTSTPMVQIDSPNVTKDTIPFKFSIVQSDQTVVDIENQNPNQTASNIILAGLIDNPLGKTTIVNVRGDILSTGPQAIVRTNSLTLKASGKIGASSNRVYADLVESTNPNTMTPMVPQLTATATTGNAYLSFTPRQAETSGGPVSVVINSITAGQQVDVLMQAGQTLPGVGKIYSGLVVTVVNTGVNPNTSTQGTYITFFHPDNPVGGALLPTRRSRLWLAITPSTPSPPAAM